MFSIITATYNAASSLVHCLESIRSQKVTGTCGASPLEHLIIDGGSTDGTLVIVEEHRNSRLTPDASRLTRVISECDHGLYDAMNKGIRMAAGDIIGILNADDFYADDRVLERVAKAFEDQDVEACYGDLVYVRETGAGRNLKTVRYWKSGPFTPEKMKWGWMPPHPTFFVRRRVYEEHGLFNLNLGSAADYELMLRFLFKHRIKTVYIPEVLVCMRAGGVSNASLGNRLKANRMDRKAWEVNGLSPYPWTTLVKPLRKIPQYLLKYRPS